MSRPTDLEPDFIASCLKTFQSQSILLKGKRV